MDQQQKKIIENNFNDLIYKANVTRLLDKLHQKKVINRTTYQNSHNGVDIKRRLFKDIQQSKNNAFQNLIDSLYEIGDGQLAQLLSPNLQNQCTLAATTSSIIHQSGATNNTYQSYTHSRKIYSSSYSSSYSRSSGLNANNSLVSLMSHRDMTQMDAKPIASVTSSSSINNVSKQSQKFSTERLGQLISLNIPPKNVDTMIEKLLFNVKPATQFLDKSDQDIMGYPTRSKNRGAFLLINNDKITGHEYRKGAEKDVENLKNLFKELRFSIKSYNNLKLKEMKNAIEEFKKSNILKKVDICMVMVLSHGGNVSSKNDNYVLSTDGLLLSTDWIIEQFNSDNCKLLLRKPKILLFNACRGSDKEIMIPKTASDGVGIPKNTPIFSDMLIGYSTNPGYVSLRDTCYGSWYVMAMCEVFMEYACSKHILDLLIMVGNKVAQKKSLNNQIQAPMYENRLFNYCYLHPKIYEENGKLKKY